MFDIFSRAGQILKGAAFGLAALGLVACVGGGGGPTISTSDPVPVALLVPKGSSGSGDALLAQSLENAARLAIADLGEVKIDLRVYDTAGDAGQAQAMATQAIEEGAKIILGPVFAEAANAVGNVAAAHNVNVLSFSNNTSIAGGNVFVLGNTFQNTASRLVAYAGAQGKGRMVVVHAENLPGQAGRDAINAGMNAGASVVATVGYEFSQQGVISAVADVRQAVSDTQADAVFLTSGTSDALPLFSQLLPEAGVDPQVTQYIGLQRWDIPAQTLELPGVQGGWFAIPDPNLTKQFESRYAHAYSGLPHPIGGLAYDGIAAIGALVKSGKTNALATSGLTQGAGFQGVNGIFRLRPDGTNERGLAIATVQNKQVVVIDPAPTRFGGAGL